MKSHTKIEIERGGTEGRIYIPDPKVFDRNHDIYAMWRYGDGFATLQLLICVSPSV